MYKLLAGAALFATAGALCAASAVSAGPSNVFPLLATPAGGPQLLLVGGMGGGGGGMGHGNTTGMGGGAASGGNTGGMGGGNGGGMGNTGGMGGGNGGGMNGGGSGGGIFGGAEPAFAGSAADPSGSGGQYFTYQCVTPAGRCSFVAPAALRDNSLRSGADCACGGGGSRGRVE